MSYEVKKVANGYVVLLPRDIRYDGGEMRDIHVFETWEKTAEWLRAKFLAA